jgi:hypothetical protein
MKSLKSLLLGAALAGALLMSGCGNSDNFVHTNTNILQGPVAVDDAINALGNATLNQTAANGVLTNDTLNGGAISAFDAVGSNGGAINLNADGSFTYTPVVGFVGAETFTYTVANQAGNSTATVTMTSTGLGLFVDNTAGAGGNGSQASPFDTLAAAITAANNGDTIFVARGDGTNTGLAGAVILPAGVDLIGEGAGLVLAQTIVPQGQPPVLTGPITANGDNTISGLTIDGSGAEGIVANGVNDLTITNNTFLNNTSNNVELDDVGGTIAINQNTMANPTTSGGDQDFIRIEAANTVATLDVSNNTFTDDNMVNSDDTCEIILTGTSNFTITCNNNTASSQNATDSFDDLFELECRGTSQAVLTFNDNVSNNSAGEILDLEVEEDAQITATATGNQHDTSVDAASFEIDVDDDIMGAGTGTVTLTATGNTIANMADGDGFDVDINLDGGTVNLIADNNNISNCGEDGMELETNAVGATLNVAVRNNTITNSTDQSVEVDLEDSGTTCVDFVGNTVTQNVTFDEDGTGTINVEQLAPGDGGPLTILNTFNNGAIVDEQSGTINSVADGTCAFP